LPQVGIPFKALSFMSNASSPRMSACLPAIPLWKSTAILLLGGLAAFGFFGLQSINQAGESGVSMHPPLLVGAFHGTPQEVSESERVVLPSDTEFAKMLYTGLSGDQVNFQIVLAGAEKRSIHRPEVCLPAQGWTISGREIVPVKLRNGKTLDVMQLTLSRQIETRPGEFRTLNSVFLYWFVGASVATPHHWMRILLTSWDRVVHRRNHRWAYAIANAAALKGLAPGGRDLAETKQLLKEFVSEVAPEVVLEWKSPAPEAPR